MGSEIQADIIVIGTVSLDTLHFSGRTLHTIGGAGLYTALAAKCLGAKVLLLAPKPAPLPESLCLIDQQIIWQGPNIELAELPRLEIEHHGGGKATLLNASWGAEIQLTPDLLPKHLSASRYLHIAALSSAQRQLDFLQAIINHKSQQNLYPLISVGTYARLAYGATEQVRTLFQQADLFFMNDNEAKALFTDLDQAQTAADKTLFITLGERGVYVITGHQTTHVPAHNVTELDPTGAGDTFCGATLAGLAQGKTPLSAAKNAVVWAAKTVNAEGPAALLGATQ